VFVRHLLEVIAKGATDLCDDLCAGVVAALLGDAESGESEAGAGDGGHEAWVALAGGVVGGGTVEHLAGFGTDLLDEVETAAALEVVEEGFVFGGKADVIWCGGTRRERGECREVGEQRGSG